VGLERFSGWRGSLPGGCSGWRMAGGVLPTVTRGGGDRLGHGGDVPTCWGSKRLGEVVQELLRGDVVLLE
jgi:hypothetical protein